MMIRYDNIWVRKIADLQHEDGSWGCFHTLSKPTKEQPVSTEQALRRLRTLGLTRGDEPIDRALQYMRECLQGKRRPPDHREKVLNRDAFESHMLAAWIRIFEPDDPLALPVARMWAEIITSSFQGGAFDENVYAFAYRKQIPKLHNHERMIMLPQFYMVNLVKGILDAETENSFVTYIIHNADGIYYVYNRRIAEPPVSFASRETSCYLAALEQLAGYPCAGEKLRFAAQWLMDHREKNGAWDLGASARDGIYFPLSDSWRKPEDRRHDCTARIAKLLKMLEAR